MTAKDLKDRLKSRPKTNEHSVKGFFTALQEDLDLLDELVDRYNEKGARTRNSEVIRVAIRALAEMKDERVLEILCGLPKSSQGPKKTAVRENKSSIK